MQPPDPKPGLIKISPGKQVVDAVRTETVVIHVHSGDVVFHVNDQVIRIGEVGKMILAERSYISTTTNSPGAATAQGDSANASGSVSKTTSSLNFDELGAELAALRAEMRKRADGSTGQDKAVAAVAEAEDSLKAKDKRALRKHLVKAGAWALAVAQEVGLTAAKDYIEGLLGPG